MRWRENFAWQKSLYEEISPKIIVCQERPGVLIYSIQTPLLKSEGFQRSGAPVHMNRLATKMGCQLVGKLESEVHTTILNDKVASRRSQAIQNSTNFNQVNAETAIFNSRASRFVHPRDLS